MHAETETIMDAVKSFPVALFNAENIVFFPDFSSILGFRVCCDNSYGRIFGDGSTRRTRRHADQDYRTELVAEAACQI